MLHAILELLYALTITTALGILLTRIILRAQHHWRPPLYRTRSLQPLTPEILQ